jgi:hypothetical protein
VKTAAEYVDALMTWFVDKKFVKPDHLSDEKLVRNALEKVGGSAGQVRCFSRLASEPLAARIDLRPSFDLC